MRVQHDFPKLSDVHIAYCIRLSVRNGIFVKYEGEQGRQFREALLGCVEALNRGGTVRFVTIDDLREDGAFKGYYALLSDGGSRLEFERHEELYTPHIVINRLKDALYSHDAMKNAPWRVYNVPQVAWYGNKAVSTEILGAYMPKTLVVRDVDTQRGDILELMHGNSRPVLKPVRENGGRGIRRVTSMEDVESERVPFVMQKFIETSPGVHGIAEGRHDLRVYVIDSVPVLMSVRHPKSGDFLANTSRGGTIEFFAAERIPSELIQTAKEIIDRMEIKRYNYFISLDFFNDGTEWLLIEVNDQPGVPAPYQTPVAHKIYQLFAESVQGVLS